MSRTLKKCFCNNLTFEKMLDAHNRAKRDKGYRYEILKFEYNLENNLVNLINKIKNNQYQLSEYKEFKIYEPKERLIKSLPYVDRVVHQWYVHEFIKSYFFSRFIKDTYACLDGRGTHKAVKAVQKYQQLYQRKYKNYYVLKMDIKKFFFNINQEILYNILKKHFTDKKLLKFTRLLIFNKEGVGLPIGNYTSQYFANIYLGVLDKYIKHNLRVKYYVRYMDDFILLVKNKAEAKKYYGLIQQFLRTNLKLELNQKSKYYPSHLGVDFCGYRIWSTHLLVRKNSKKKMLKRIKKWKSLKKKGVLDYKIVTLSFNSWLSHIKHANSYNLFKIIMRKIIILKEVIHGKI